METIYAPGPYEQALTYALANDVNMSDFDYGIEHRGPRRTRNDLFDGTFVGPWTDPDTGEAL